MNPVALLRLWPLALAVLAFWAGWEWRDRSADIRDLRTANAGLTARVAEVNKTLDTERRKAQALAAVADQYEADKREIEARTETLVADLRAGNVRLHNRWKGCEATSELSGAVAGALSADAAARDREESASRIVQAADEADAIIRGLQAVIEADRK